VSITDTSLFDCEFFSILEMAYKRHLQPALVTFGQGMMSAVDLKEFIVASEEDDEDVDMQVDDETVEVVWEKAFKAYGAEVCNMVGAWAQEKLLMADLTTRIVLDALVPKMKFLLDNGMLGNHKLLPKTGARLPFLSILFFMDLCKSLANVSDGIALVGPCFVPVDETPIHVSSTGPQLV
jgi:hypothetical protein